MGRGDSKRLAVTGKHEHAHAAAARGHRDKEAPLLQCTTHMCPVRVHWHVKLNYKEYWRAKIAITNFNYHLNYTQWTLVAQHPNLDNITEVFSFDYKPVVAYGSISNCLFSIFPCSITAVSDPQLTMHVPMAMPLQCAQSRQDVN